MEADLGEWGEQQDLLQELPLSRTNPLAPTAQHGWYRNIISEGRTEPSAKSILCQVIFFVHLWVHKNIANAPVGGEDLVTANASLLTKGLLFLAPFADSSEDLPSPDTPS